MRKEPKSIQRSFRLSKRTVELLDAAASEYHESRNSLADRLLGEAIRVERHPFIRFHAGSQDRRQPLLIGTRLYVYQAIATLRASDGNIEEAANYFGIPNRLMQAALDYYAEFTKEIDDDAKFAAKVERDSRARWERQQRALA